MAVLAMHGVEMRFAERPVLHGVTLAIGAGEVVGLTGPNGVGKSTLLRLAAGLLRPQGGHVRVLGQAPVRARRRGCIGWSTSGEASFTRRLSLRANLALAAALSGVPHARVRIESLAERLDFRADLERPAGQCSSGVRQRAALARALLHRPALLLLDEPLRGVDAASALALARELRAGWRREAVLWVSHARDELAVAADRIVALEDGCLRARGTSAAAA